MSSTKIPSGYESSLSLYQTQAAISVIHQVFEKKLGDALNLIRVSAPLFVEAKTGLNDDLSGRERAVNFDIKETGSEAVVVHSLAKWKRMALHKYGFPAGEGIYTDMNAIRRDEEMDNLHSIYVDQWDWEKVITKNERTKEYLYDTVKKIVCVICDTADALSEKFPTLNPKLSREVSFISSQELEDMYPGKSPKERENEYLRAHKTAFIYQIGGELKSGKPHDMRAPDYDDWSLNGDIMFYNEILDCAFEISSMGIRVDAEALDKQLKIANADDRRKLTFHKMLLENKLPLTIGGGIGQSRLSMLLLEKAHIGEVQSSVWDSETERVCAQNGIILL
ncbi:MAG: aspartate--ammonia ligase [Clostridiales bacterium]|nr:aspartate--ammonia ligase [Clostridiales bacterium]